MVSALAFRHLLFPSPRQDRAEMGSGLLLRTTQLAQSAKMADGNAMV
jgi:hypothetical protein